jgi:hypothetical protein
MHHLQKAKKKKSTALWLDSLALVAALCAVWL